jgi:hypothetical protein
MVSRRGQRGLDLALNWPDPGCAWSRVQPAPWLEGETTRACDPRLPGLVTKQVRVAFPHYPAMVVADSGTTLSRRGGRSRSCANIGLLMK